jgi:hypothetical protein
VLILKYEKRPTTTSSILFRLTDRHSLLLVEGTCNGVIVIQSLLPWSTPLADAPVVFVVVNDDDALVAQTYPVLNIRVNIWQNYAHVFSTSSSVPTIIPPRYFQDSIIPSTLTRPIDLSSYRSLTSDRLTRQARRKVEDSTISL